MRGRCTPAVTKAIEFARRAGAKLQAAILFFSLAVWSVSAAPESSKGDSNDPDIDKEGEAQIIQITEDTVVLPEPIPDPIEPVNRRLWELNKGLMVGVVKPTAKVYRFVVIKPLRKGIRNVGRNIAFPRKVINNMLQERWTGARDETYRFLANSVLGIGGLFDVATKFKIPESDADFGQTFGAWGWRPGVYLMLPILGPSNERDALGSVADGLVNPLSYFPPYSYISYGITYNNLTDTVDDYVRVIRSDLDPYAVLRYAWTLKRESRGVDLGFEGEQDPATLETLQSVFFTFQDEEFPEDGKSKSVFLDATGKKFPYSYWLQKNPSPLVYVLPGIGGHRLGGGTLALAELLFKNGYSVVTVSSPFNFEFMELGATTPLPGYTPVDSQDLKRALAAIDAELEAKFPARITSRALMGYSMGGFHTLYAAGTTDKQVETNRLAFDRYVAIDTPVRLTYAMNKLDGYFREALNWPAGERQEKIQGTFLKVAALSQHLETLTTNSVIPFNAIESRFLLGLAFRLNLRDVIFLSQERTNMGVLKTPLDEWRREPVYQEILQYSFGDYLKKFVTPYYQGRGIDLTNPEEMAKATDLREMESVLKGNEKVRVIVNANDVLLAPSDVDWVQQTFPNASIFPRGGHLGNLADPRVQAAILQSLEGLSGDSSKK